MTDDEIIAVVQAHANGERIEWSKKGSGGPWYGFSRPEHDDWSFGNRDFRVAPRKPRELWLLKSVTDGYWRECDEKPIYDIGNILHVRVIEE